ncbi:MAG: hypothetical protein WC910_11305, partial [Bacteroidales bacterium]
FGFIFLAVLIGSSGGVYRTPFSFPDIQPPQIVMPELQTVNISHLNITFPEFEPEIGVSPVEIELEPEAEIEPEVESAPEPESPYDVRIYQKDNFIITEAAGEPTAALPVSSDAADLFKAAVDAVPDGGSLHIGAGHYNLSAPYSFALNPDGSNIFYSAIQVLDKDMVISGDGMDETILHLLPGQRRPSRHVAMMLIRGTRGYDPGYESFTVTGLTLDGNRAEQIDGQPHDGEGLILVGSERTNGKYHGLGLENSWGSGIYLGNNGAGDSGTNEIVSRVVAQNCGAEGIILDTCHNSTVIDSEGWKCREGLVLYGNDDYKARSPDNVSASRFQTDSQVTVWQVNDFTISDLMMNCTNTTGSYGLMIRDGTGTVKYSVLVSSKTREDSTGGATYILEGSDVLFDNCLIEGYFGVHAIGRAHVEVTNCRIDAPGGCYCMTDLVPVQSTIVARDNTCTGKELATQDGATFYNF